MIGFAFLLWGTDIFSRAQSAMHEIEALLCYVALSIFLVGFGIIDAIDKPRAGEAKKAKEPAAIAKMRQAVAV